MNLLGRTKIVPSIVPTAGAIGTATATVIDCAGFDRVCHVIAIGAAGGASTFDYKVQESAASGGTYSDVADADLTQVAATGASKVYAIDVPVNSAKPYQKAVASVGTATFANAAVAVLYEGSGTYPKTAATEAIII